MKAVTKRDLVIGVCIVVAVLILTIIAILLPTNPLALPPPESELQELYGKR